MLQGSTGRNTGGTACTEKYGYYTTSRKDLGVPEIDRKELEEFIDAIPEIPVIVRDNIKEDARIKAFDLKKRMLYDIKEFGEDNEGE